MSGYNKVVDHYNKKTESSSRPKVVLNTKKTTQESNSQGRKRKLGIPAIEASIAPDPDTQEKNPDTTGSPYRIVVLPGVSEKRSPTSSNTLVPSTDQKPSILLNRKIVKLTKPIFKQLSEKGRTLVNECVASIADQEDLRHLKLHGREELNQEEWNRVAGVLIELLHSHFSENSDEEIDFAAIREARLAIKETYSWGGYVTHNFNPIEFVKNISEDGVYSLLRRKNNSKKGNEKRIDLNKRTLNVQSGLNGKNKRRTADSYGVLTPLDFFKEDKSKVEHRSYMLFCEKLSKLDEGVAITDDIVLESKQYLKFFIDDMKNARPENYADLRQSFVFDFIKHFQIYECVVEVLANRKNMFRDFEHQCAMYLHSLKDLTREFPPLVKEAMNTLDFEKFPYMSLAAMISMQLGREPKFLINIADANPETISSHRPIYLIQRGDLYDLWVQTALIIGSLSEKQALFAFATVSDVLGISLRKHVNSSDILDFLRKFIVNLPDFVISRKQVEILGHAYFHYAYRQLIQHVDKSSISLPIGVQSAKTAILLL